MSDGLSLAGVVQAFKGLFSTIDTAQAEHWDRLVTRYLDERGEPRTLRLSTSTPAASGSGAVDRSVEVPLLSLIQASGWVLRRVELDVDLSDFEVGLDRGLQPGRRPQDLLVAFAPQRMMGEAGATVRVILEPGPEVGSPSVDVELLSAPDDHPGIDLVAKL